MKKDQNDKKTVIHYADIDRIICVPEKDNNILLYAKFNKKIHLRHTKSQKIEHLALLFEDTEKFEDSTEKRDICNTNTPITATTLNGTFEANFCRVFSDLCQKSIDRHDQMLFRRSLESKQKVFFIDSSVGCHNACIYPLRSGLFITPKPLRFVPIAKIKYYEFT